MDSQASRSRQILKAVVPTGKAVAGFATALRKGLTEQLYVESETSDSCDTPPSLPATEQWNLNDESDTSFAQHSLSLGKTHKFKLTISTGVNNEGLPEAQVHWDDRSIDMIGCLFPDCGNHGTETVEDCARFFGAQLEDATDGLLGGRDRYTLRPRVDLREGDFPSWLAWTCANISDERCHGSVRVKQGQSANPLELAVRVNKGWKSSLSIARPPQGNRSTSQYAVHFPAASTPWSCAVSLESGGCVDRTGYPVDSSDIVARQLKIDLESGGRHAPAIRVLATWARGHMRSIDSGTMQWVLDEVITPKTRWAGRITVLDCAETEQESLRGYGLLTNVSVTSYEL